MLELICPFGHENFERVIVERKPGSPIVTDFVACVGCRTMYFVPIERQPHPPSQLDAIGSGGGPGRPPGPNSWGATPSTPRREQSPEEKKALLEAAARANKSKRKR